MTNLIYSLLRANWFVLVVLAALAVGTVHGWRESDYALFGGCVNAALLFIMLVWLVREGTNHD